MPHHVEEAVKARGAEEQVKIYRRDLANLRIQRLELEQKDADRETLQVMDDAIRKREQQLDKALYHRWWERPSPVPIKRSCGHSLGSVLRPCCKTAGISAESAEDYLRHLEGLTPVTTAFNMLR